MDYCVSKVRDKIRLYEKTDIISSTNFLTPAEVEEALPVLRGKEFCLSGGFEEAERRIIIIGTKDDVISEFCNCLRIEARDVIKLSHRDVLGSVLGLGIKREMLGDIIVNENVCDIIVMREMCEYVLNNLNKIGKNYDNATFSIRYSFFSNQFNFGYQGIAGIFFCKHKP